VEGGGAGKWSVGWVLQFGIVNTADMWYSYWRSILILTLANVIVPIPVAVRSKTWVCGRSLTGIVVSNPTGGMDVCVVFVV
jgi:hypothetical protein